MKEGPPLIGRKLLTDQLGPSDPHAASGTLRDKGENCLTKDSKEFKAVTDSKVKEQILI
jgi:hypothetical protein